MLLNKKTRRIKCMNNKTLSLPKVVTSLRAGARALPPYVAQ
jgi:hypothetical protein